MKTIQTLMAGLSIGALTLVSCTPTQQKYGLGGAAAGGVVGAIAGGDSGDIARAAAIAGAAGTGYAIYRENQNNNQRVVNQPAPPAPAPTGNYPAAFPTQTPNVVISPHKPYNKVNVKGIAPGRLATDPTTGQIFVVPQ